jgi:hypothetical protein
MGAHPVPTLAEHCMDAPAIPPHHAPVHVLAHIKKLDDAFGQFLARVIRDCGACREIEPEALARLVGWKVTEIERPGPFSCVDGYQRLQRM